MRGLMGTVIAGLCLAGCSSSKEEIQAAAQSSFSYLTRAAETLDDQKSDPMTVAYGMLGACNSQLNEAAAVTANGLSYDGYQQVKRRQSEFNLKLATEIVLRERAARVSGTTR